MGSFQTVIRSVLVPLLQQLPSLHPGVELRIREGDEAQLDRWLRAGEVDIAVFEYDAQAEYAVPAGMREVPLLDDPWWIVLPVGHDTPMSFHDLHHSTWLGSQPGGASARALTRLSMTTGVELPTVHEYYEFSVARSVLGEGRTKTAGTCAPLTLDL